MRYVVWRVFSRQVFAAEAKFRQELEREEVA